MIAFPPGARVWLAGGVTDMRKGMNGLTLLVQEGLSRDPHAGDLFVFRGRRGHMVKILWHDGVGLSLSAKRLEHGRFIWPTPADGSVAISARSSATCSTGSTGAIRGAPGDRLRQGDSPGRRGAFPLQDGALAV